MVNGSIDLDFFNENGFFIIKNAITEDKINAYLDLWNRENADNPSGWSNIGGSAAAYLEYSEILDILCDPSIANAFDVAEKSVALHADITYSVTTELEWHQDNCMPNEIAGSNYMGVWVALENVDEDAGPFEFVPGSHNWDMDYNLLHETAVKGREHPDLNDQRIKYYQDQINTRSAKVEKLLIEKGDAFIWHGRLMHRGSPAVDRSKTRMSLIGHYCNNYANLEEVRNPSFDFQKKEMFEETSRYASWGENGAFYFVNP